MGCKQQRARSRIAANNLIIAAAKLAAAKLAAAKLVAATKLDGAAKWTEPDCLLKWSQWWADQWGNRNWVELSRTFPPHLPCPERETAGCVIFPSSNRSKGSSETQKAVLYIFSGYQISSSWRACWLFLSHHAGISQHPIGQPVSLNTQTSTQFFSFSDKSYFPSYFCQDFERIL